MSTAKIVNPDGIKCTLEFTLTMKEWKKVRVSLSLNPSYAETQIMLEISDLVHQLENTLYDKTGGVDNG